MAKRVVTAYALWALGGPLGLHHLYLGRDSHALLWLLTLGGFGVGWVREFFRIPSYVDEANREVSRGTPQHPQARPPPMSLARFAGQICVGIYFGTVALIGLNSLSFFYLMVLPLCVGAGVHLRSVTPAHQPGGQRHRHPAPAVQTARPAGAPPKPLGSRLYRLGLAWLAFSAPLGYCVFHNTTATLYYLSDCVAAVLDALWFFPWLGGALEYLLLLPYRILCAFTGGGIAEESWRMVLEILLREYSQKEKEALKVLLVSEEASLEEITHSYRELVKVWHPDRNHDRAEEAQQMFIQIQEAYETLLRRHRAFHRK
ncbi:hypothetical protein ANANG_G00221380 [Anguilla anguilla]|uniref:DnaJ homolog subfamily C member 22 n=1 Tax=Anguilla anguilla TaxID=7936 RepID=A0A9D3RQ42_ANGAN|nr:hypothetical protein ANANG_G00221380 [Anguilla anguilla]